MISTQDHSYHDELPAQLTDIAYRALLRRGLRHSFLDVELELWHEIQESFHEPANALRSAEGALS